MSTKVCPGCPENGPQSLEAFYACSRSKDCHQTRCKVCQRAYQAANSGAAAGRARKQTKVHKKGKKFGPGTLFRFMEEM